MQTHDATTAAPNRSPLPVPPVTRAELPENAEPLFVGSTVVVVDELNDFGDPPIRPEDRPPADLYRSAHSDITA